MNIHNLYILVIAVIATMVISCKPHRDTVTDDSKTTVAVVGYNSRPLTGNSPSMYLPKAVIYQTNGNYNNNMFINLNSSRTAIESYPAVTDITADSAPLDLGDGWLLDRRGGIGPNSAFLTYTWSEYASLPQTPSQQTLMSTVIPNARVTRVLTLPITYSEARNNPEIVKKYIPKDN